MIIMPIIVIFFQENGLTLKEVMILQGVYSLLVALMEIPSGYLADVFGRKHTLSLGAILAFIGFLILSLSYSFWPFFIGEIILGIGASFISGADSALLYDSLIESKKENDYTKVEGRAYGIGNFSEALAGICGGLLADISLRYPMFLQVFIAALIIPITFSLIEPKAHRENSLPKNFKAIWEVVKFALVENKLLKWLIILSSIIGFSTLSMAWFAQPYFKSIDLPIKYFGFIWAILNLSTGFSSMNAYRFDNIFSKKILSFIIALGISLPIIILSGSGPTFGLLMVLTVYVVRGIATPLLRNFINEITESNIRATVLSVRSFCIRITFSVFAPLMGWVADIYSLQQSFMILGIMVLTVSLISCFKLLSLSND